MHAVGSLVPMEAPSQLSVACSTVAASDEKLHEQGPGNEATYCSRVVVIVKRLIRTVPVS